MGLGVVEGGQEVGFRTDQDICGGISGLQVWGFGKGGEIVGKKVILDVLEKK